MLKEVFLLQSLLWGPKIALLIFFGFSTLLLVWIFRPRSESTYTKISAAALTDD